MTSGNTVTVTHECVVVAACAWRQAVAAYSRQTGDDLPEFEALTAAKRDLMAAVDDYWRSIQ